MTALVIIGAGGHGQVVASIARACGREVLGFLDDDPRRGALGPISTWPDFLAHPLHVALGNDRLRLQLAREILAAGANLETLVHPRSTIDPSVRIGPGSVLVAGSVANVGAKIGTAVIINTRASADHHVEIGDGAQICPNVTLLGGCAIGEMAFIGAGSVVERLVRVGPRAVVCAMSFVKDDVPAGARVKGQPSRVVRAQSTPVGPAPLGGASKR